MVCVGVFAIDIYMNLSLSLYGALWIWVTQQKMREWKKKAVVDQTQATKVSTHGEQKVESGSRLRHGL